MCPIFGMSANEPISEERMRSALQHMCTDRYSSGEYCSVSPRNMFWSPEAIEQDDICLVFDGDIYNDEHVRRQLRETGCSFTSKTDAEIFLQSYREDGLNGLQQLRGRWAAGVHNMETETTTVITDPFSRIPVYYHQDKQRLAFATTITPLFTSLGIEAAPHDEVVTDFLRYGVTDHREETCFAGIRRLQPGTAAVFDSGERDIRSYPVFDETPQQELLPRIKESVNLRSPDNESCAVAVSGGIDSPTVAALLQDQHPGLFSVAFPGKSFNEASFVEALAENLETAVDILPVTGSSILDEVPHTIADHEEPVATIQAQIHSILCRHINQAGNRTVFMGTGPDEYFCGYAYLITQHILDLLRQRKFRTAFSMITGYRDQLSFSYLTYRLLPDAVSDRLEQLFGGDMVSQYIEEPERYERPSILHSAENLDKAIRRRLFVNGLPATLRVASRNARANALTCRTPLLDKTIVNYALDADSSKQFSPPTLKSGFRSTVQHLLPGALMERTEKVGFAHSTEEWYDDDGVRERFEQVFSSERFHTRPHINAEKIYETFQRNDLPFYLAYRFYVYEHWMRNFFD